MRPEDFTLVEAAPDPADFVPASEADIREAKRKRLVDEMGQVRQEAIAQQTPGKTQPGGVLDQVGIGLTQGFAQLGQAANRLIAESARNKLAPVWWIPGASEWGAEQFGGAAQVAGRASRELEQLGQSTQGPDLVRQVSAGAVSTVPSMVVAPAGLPAAAFVAGLQSFGGAMDDAQQAYQAQGMDEDSARRKAYAPALASGVVTALVTRGFGKTGVENWTEVFQGQGWKPIAKSIAKESGFEAGEEWWDQVGQGVVQKLTYNPDLTVQQAFEESAQAGLAGAIAAGGLHGINLAGQRGAPPAPPQAPQTPPPGPPGPPGPLPGPPPAPPAPPSNLDPNQVPPVIPPAPSMMPPGAHLVWNINGQVVSAGPFGPGVDLEKQREQIARTLPSGAEFVGIMENPAGPQPSAPPGPPPQPPAPPTPAPAPPAPEETPEDLQQQLVEDQGDETAVAPAVQAEASSQDPADYTKVEDAAAASPPPGVTSELNVIPFDAYGIPAGLFRGTESGSPEATLRETEGGELGGGYYLTPSRDLAATYGGGPTASVKAGSRVVHEFSWNRTIGPDDVAYLKGGAAVGTEAQLLSGVGFVIWAGKWSGGKSESENRDAMFRAAKAAGVKVLIGLDDSVARNQVAILDRSIIKPAASSEAQAEPPSHDPADYTKVEQQAVDTGTQEAETKAEAQDDRRDAGQPGQSVAGAPGMDVREPAGPGVAVTPAEPTGPTPGPEAPEGAGDGGSTQGSGAKRGRGVRSGGGQRISAGRRPGDERQPAGPATPEPAAVGSGAPEAVTPPPDPNAVNHVLPADQDWIPRGDKAKVHANLAAIRLLKQLEAEGRNATPDEKAVLAKYVGWGGLKEVFDEGKAAYRDRPPRNELQQKEYDRWEKSWGKLYDEVKRELGDKWGAAAKSILNAHYTSRTVINGVWAALNRLGFKGGNALEPSGGIGHFIGLQPDTSRPATRWHSVELDDTSARILAKLYPQAQTQATGFEVARLPVGAFDLVTSNVPFRAEGPYDKRYPKFSLHNYFFARALDLVKPGGLVAFITSDSTLDSDTSTEARQYIAERADLVGAIRLPNTAFKENAGTEVTTDILFLRKRDGTPFTGAPFVRTAEAKTYKGEPIEINEYFVAHPEMLLGRLSLEGTMYQANQRALLPTPGADLSQQLAEAVSRLPENVMGAQPTPEAITIEEAVKGKVGGLLLKDGKLAILNADGTTETPEWSGSPKAVEQAKAYIQTRDDAKRLIAMMIDPDSSDDQVAEARVKLNGSYDAYVKKFGPFNARRSQFLDDDVDFPLALALEDGETRLVETKNKSGAARVQRVTDWKKAKIFFERTIFPRVPPAKVDTIDDGLQVSLNFRGRVDVDYIAELSGKSVDDVKERLSATGQAFENPETGQFEAAWKYLSGFVKKKLGLVRERVGDNPLYKYNVEALEKVIPAPIAFENIGFRLGSTFIPPSVVEQFVEQKLGVRARVSFTPKTGNWHVEVGTGADSEQNRTQWGVHGFTGVDLVRLALNLKGPVVTVTERRVSESTGKPYDAEVKDPKATLEAEEKQHQVRQAFVDWARQSPEAARAIETVYNDENNGTALPKFDPPTWEHYPGASTDIRLRQHQKKVVTRGLQNSFGLFHAVGTGKTFIGVTWAMELRRLGLARKPVIVVQNATLEQFARSFKRLYPTARILAPNARQRDAKYRNRTMSRIATGDWDAVIVPQSFMNMLPDDPARERQYVNDQIRELKEAKIEAELAEGGRSPKAADLQRAVERLEKRLAELRDRAQDDVLTFEQLGVDALFVDEAHAYKKLQFSTKMDSIKGLDTGASQRGFSMLMKVRWVQEKNQGRNVIFATGTPVSNTIAEAWTMMRYLRPDVLREYRMENFDAFAANFGDTVTQLEMTAAGTWKPVTRFARYTNGPELIAAWRTVADVVTPEEVNLPDMPALKNGKTTPVVIPQTESVSVIVQQLRATLAAFEAMTGRAKRENSHIPLVVFGSAKKMSVDPRLYDSSLPDEPGSKLNVAADRIYQIWAESAEVRGAQMVFADSFRSSDGVFNAHIELKRKLVARGIPESDIAIVDEKTKDARREALFTKVNDGEIRVVIGSSERMGVGVNAQEHLIALHHLDAPPRPMDVEQRNGRILRQGNQNPEIEIVSYGVENTLDAAMFQKLATKKAFINQILRGDIQGRNFEDAANEITMSFEEQMAAFSGDSLALEKVTLENQVRTLEALQAGHHQQIRQARDNLAELVARRIPSQERLVEEVGAVAKAVASAFADKDALVLKFGREFKGRKAISAFLDEFLKGAIDQRGKELADLVAQADKSGMALRYGYHSGVDSSAVLGGFEIKFRPQGYVYEGKVRDIDVSYQLTGVQGSYPHAVTSGQGFFASLESELKRLTSSVPEEAKATLEKLRRDRIQLAGFVEQPFARESELAAAKARLAEVLSKINAATAATATAAAPKTVMPLGFEVARSKPLEAEREHVRRLLEMMGRRQSEFEEWWALPAAHRPDPEPLGGHLAWIGSLEIRLGQIERQLVEQARERVVRGLNIKLGSSQAGFVVNPAQLIADLITYGKDVVRRLGGWGVSFARWSASMVRQFGAAVKVHLQAVWARLANLARSSLAGLSPEGVANVNRIEAQGEQANKVEIRPVYPDGRRDNFWRQAGRPSRRLAYFGSPSLLRSKQELDLEESYQSAAVKAASDRLLAQLERSAYDARPDEWKLPRWMRTGAWARRLRLFKRLALPIAAHLNVTGRNPSGDFVFSDFEMRSGLMTVREFVRGQHSVGAVITVDNPLTGASEEMTIGNLVTLPNGRSGYQLTRQMSAAQQAELYRHYADEFPELMWLVDMYVDPDLAGVRQTVNGIQVPLFNRFSQAAMMGDTDPRFQALEAYTPDVLVSRSLMGAVRGALGLRRGTRSPGRRYKTGSSRESGAVRDLLTGHNIRTFQMLQERARRQFFQAILRTAAPIPGGVVPEGFVKLDLGMDELWQAVKRLRWWRSPRDPVTGAPLFPETEARMGDNGSPEYKAFFGEAASLRGRQLMISQALLDTLLRKYAAHQEHGMLYRLGAWFVRNSTQLFLAHPKTYVANVLTNDLFAIEAAYRHAISGIAKLDGRDLRYASGILAGMVLNRFKGLRELIHVADNTRYMRTVREVLPDQLFADATQLSDVKVRYDDTWFDLLRRGELGGATLQIIQYGTIDVRAKQRMAYAWLHATAITNARRAGLRGRSLRAAVDGYMANPPMEDRARAVAAANFELLNYSDSPDWLNRFSRHDYGRLVLPFPRFGYHYLAKQKSRLEAVRLLIGRVPKGQRADAFADLVTVATFGLGGAGLVFSTALRALLDMPDEEDARQHVGTSTVRFVDEDGRVKTKAIDRELVTSNRVNLSYWARALGLDTDMEDDFWLRTRNYPVIAMAGAAALAIDDARRFGPQYGVATYASTMGDLAGDFFSVGMALKVPDKALASLRSLASGRPEKPILDPYATNVPFLAYLAEQAVDSVLPGSRQVDEVIWWLDPIQRRKTASSTLDFYPGVWDGLRAGHVTGLLDRILSDGASTLPPAGEIDRVAGAVADPREIPVATRVLSLGGFNVKPIDRAEYEEALAR